MKALFTVLLLLICLSSFSQKIIYVRRPYTGGLNDGTSWLSPFAYLQDALNAAESGDQIWVAAGTHYPDQGLGQINDSRSAHFELKTGVAIYGGFKGDGTEIQLSQRDWINNVTVLSGEIQQDNDNTNNSYNVVFNGNNDGVFVDNTAVLDGFTIAGGNSNDRLSLIGGGMYNVQGPSPTIRNCIFSGNSATERGGGMYNRASSPTLINCIFSGNSATLGGGMYNETSSPILTGCSFFQNTADTAGGGIFNNTFYSSPTLTNCSFSGNSAIGRGGAIANDGSSPTLINCIFTGNSVSSLGGGIYSEYSSAIVTNCIFSGNRADQGGGIYNGWTSSPTVSNCSFSQNTAIYVSGGGMRNSQSSPTVSNCIFGGNTGLEIVNTEGSSPTITYSVVQGAGLNTNGNKDQDPLFVNASGGDLRLQSCSPAINAGDNTANGTTTDLDGNPRIFNNGTIDMGAYEYQGSPTTRFTYYRDADGDSYGNPDDFIISCSATLPNGYVTDNTDCNDDPNNGGTTVHSGQTWFQDIDGDGHAGASQLSCGTPQGQGWTTTQKLVGDCNDNNASVWRTGIFYKDADGDGYTVGNGEQLCYGSNTPNGYSATKSAADDCNDGDINVWRTGTFYKDADGDGYTVGTGVQRCYGENIPLQYRATRSAADDCDDNDANIWRTGTFYKDADSDGYTVGNGEQLCYGNSTPSGYRTQKSNAEDCNDDPQNGGFNEHPGQTWYIDNDGDGYAGSSTTACARPTKGKLTSELKGTNTDCKDNDPVINPNTIWYKDGDNDGYSDGTKLTQCTRPTGYKLASELKSTSATDCKDGDAAINPGAVEVCGNGLDDNCNRQTDEAGCTACTNGSNFTTTNVTSGSATLNWSAVANPMQWQVEYKSTAPGTKWIDVPVARWARSVTITGLKANQSYNWHIRALCGKTCTSYSNAVSFKTPATTNIATYPGEITLTDRPVIQEENLRVKAMPNPASACFTLVIQSGSEKTVTMRVFDVLGRVVEDKAGLAANTTLRIGDKYRPGVYIAQILQGDKAVTVKLVKQPD